MISSGRVLLPPNKCGVTDAESDDGNGVHPYNFDYSIPEIRPS